MTQAVEIQHNFNAGEWSPKLFGRSDIEKYYNALATCQNFMPQRYGGLTRRPGTRFVAEVKDSDRETRLVGFQFSTTQAYVLEFGHEYVRFHRDRAQLTDSGTPVEVATPYTEDELKDLRFVQSADILYICHPDHQPRELRRSSDTDWSLATFDFEDGPYQTVNDDADHTLTPSGTGEGDAITLAASMDTFASTDVGRLVRLRISSRLIHNMGPSAGGSETLVRIGRNHTFRIGDTIRISGTKDYDGDHTILRIGPTSDPVRVAIGVAFTYDQSATRNEQQELIVDATGGTYTLSFEGETTGAIDFDATAATVQSELEGLSTIGSGNVSVSGGPGDDGGNNPYTIEFTGDLSEQDVADLTADDSSLTGDATITEEFRGNDGDTARVSGTGIGDDSLWGTVKITGFTDERTVDAEVTSELNGAAATPDWRLGAWSDTTGWPYLAAFHQQRLWFAGTDEQPQTVWGSVVGDFVSFRPSGTDGVVVDDNAVAYTIDADEVNAVRWVASAAQGMLVGTRGGEFLMRGSGAFDPISPTNVGVQPNSHYGSAERVEPVRSGRTILFAQRAGRKVRELVFNFGADQYVSPNMSLLAEHLFAGSTIADLAYQEEPDGVLWCVLNDGTLLSFTYERDQDVQGWAAHPLGGPSLSDDPAEVESVAVISDDPYDLAWLVVKRTLGGETTRTVEFIEDPFERSDDQADAFFVDCGLSYDGAATSTVSGLDHLDGEEVAVFADGGVHPRKTVNAGSIELDYEAEKVHVGLPYASVARTVPIEPKSARFAPQGKIRGMPKAIFRLDRSLGGEVRLVTPDIEGDTLPLVVREGEQEGGTPPGLFSGVFEQTLEQVSGRTLQLDVTLDEPTPLTILNAIYELNVGGSP